MVNVDELATQLHLETSWTGLTLRVSVSIVSGRERLHLCAAERDMRDASGAVHATSSAGGNFQRTLQRRLGIGPGQVHELCHRAQVQAESVLACEAMYRQPTFKTAA